MPFPSNQRYCKTYRLRKWVCALVAIFSFLVAPSPKAEMNLAAIPAEYGEVIYRYKEKSPNQLFIIGMSHRDFISGLNGQNTCRVQAEVYKLGEWLVRNRGLELLLPEGFFKKTGQMAKEKPKTGAKNSVCAEPLDIKVVERQLADNTTFINAEMLLLKNYHLRVLQVEDQKWYDTLSGFMRNLFSSGNANENYFVRPELDYLQERRTAVMLQKIPETIDAEYQQGGIKSKRALFTIGMSHLHKIIQYLDESKIRIYCPLVNLNKNEDYVADLNLLKEDFGVVIILPRTLANDSKILEINRLEKAVEKCRKKS